MEQYLRNPKHRNDVFVLRPGASAPLGLDFTSGRPRSLIKKLNGFGAPCSVTCERSVTLPGEHWLYVLAVEHVPDALYRRW
jgi:hypothetical protein